jgi:IclR family acetate operon transcriptional repressor
MPGTQAIDRALAVLNCFAGAEGELGIKDIAGRVGLSQSTVHRITRALVARGFLSQNARTERYHLGRATMLLGQIAQRGFGLDQALHLLESLGERTGESVNLGLPDGDAVVVMLRVQSPQPLRFDQPPGTRIALHCSSMGKSLLAFGHDTAWASERLPRVTPNTITGRKDLERELRIIRDRGYSTDDEESILGVCCVGAPVLDPSGRARAAIAVQAPSVRMPPERTEELAELVMTTARDVASVMRLDLVTPNGAVPT